MIIGSILFKNFYLLIRTKLLPIIFRVRRFNLNFLNDTSISFNLVGIPVFMNVPKSGLSLRIDRSHTVTFLKK